jgi:hypothetical protein
VQLFLDIVAPDGQRSTLRQLKAQRARFENNIHHSFGNYIDDYLRHLFKNLHSTFIFRLQSVRESATIEE